jgi:hypothetical protein
MGIVGFTTPASATLQLYLDIGGTIFTANDSATPGIISLAPMTINGVVINGEFDASEGNPTTPGNFFISSSVTTVHNTNSHAISIDVVVSDTDFTGPQTGFVLSGSGTWLRTPSSTLTENFFYDTSNTQGANSSGNTPGALIGAYTSPPASASPSFSFNQTPSVTGSPVFSFTEQSEYTLAAGGRLIGRQQVASAVPEISTWAMMALGFCGLGLAGSRRARKSVPSV